MWKYLFSGSDACAQRHDCQHICINNGDSYNCKCQMGYVLNADQKTCSRKNFLFLFFCDIQWYLQDSVSVQHFYTQIIVLVQRILASVCLSKCATLALPRAVLYMDMVSMRTLNTYNQVFNSGQGSYFFKDEWCLTWQLEPSTQDNLRWGVGFPNSVCFCFLTKHIPM